MSGGSQPTQTSTTQMVLSPEQRQILQLAMPGIRDYAATTPTRYPGDTVAGFDPAQISGQNMALAAATGPQQNLAQGSADTTSFWLNPNSWDPSNNPALSGAIDAAVRPITTNYQQVVEPRVRDEFLGAGQEFGGSRRNIAEAQAGEDYLRQVGDTSSKMVQGAYDTNVNAGLRALALTPQTQAAQTQPAITTSGVGDVRQNLVQRLLDMTVGNYNYDQLAPFLQSQDLVSLLGAIPGGSSTTVATGNNPTANPYTSTLGGAAAGASLGSMLGPVGTAGGAGLGALLGYFGTR